MYRMYSGVGGKQGRDKKGRGEVSDILIRMVGKALLKG